VFSPSANAVYFLSSTSLFSLLFSQQEFLSSSCSLNKNASAPLVLSTRMLQLLLLLASHQEPLGLSPRFLLLLLLFSWHLTKSLLASHQESLSLSCSLNKNAATFLFLASHQEPLGISPRISCSLNKTVVVSTSLPKNGCAHLP
jgi:hypothetical protein